MKTSMSVFRPAKSRITYDAYGYPKKNKRDIITDSRMRVFGLYAI